MAFLRCRVTLLQTLTEKERSMTANQGEDETLIVNGMAVDARLLEARPMRHCRVEECQAHCCGGGVSISTQQAEDILAHAELIQPYLPPDRRDPLRWFDGVLEPEYDHPAGGTLTNTTVVADPTHPMGATASSCAPTVSAVCRRRASRRASTPGASSRSTARCIRSRLRSMW